MITEENLDTDSGEIHYVSENGRVEGLILDQDPLKERTRRERPRSAKGRRRPGTHILDGGSYNSDSDGSCRTYNVESINEHGVNELFADILYDPENEDRSDVSNISDYENEDDSWNNHNHHLHSRRNSTSHLDRESKSHFHSR